MQFCESTTTTSGLVSHTVQSCDGDSTSSSSPRVVQNLPSALDNYFGFLITLGLFLGAWYLAYCFTRDKIKLRKF